MTVALVFASTSERLGLLRGAISSLVELATPPAEVIVALQGVTADSDNFRALVSDLRHLGLPFVLATTLGTGLSANRNTGLAACGADAAVVADDDCCYASADFDGLDRLFERHPDALALTLRARTIDGHPYKRYGPTSFPHRFATIFGVSSIEIVLNLTRCRRSKLEPSFEPAFGLGGAFQAGEEIALLGDLLASGHEVWYEPFDVAVHPTPQLSVVSAGRHAAVGALAGRFYGVAGPLAIMAYALRRPRRRDALSAWRHAMVGWSQAMVHHAVPLIGPAWGRRGSIGSRLGRTSVFACRSRRLVDGPASHVRDA